MTSTMRAGRIAVLAVLAMALATALALSVVSPASAAASGRQTVLNNARVCVQSESYFNWYSVQGGFSEYMASGNTYAKNPGSCSGTLSRPNGWMATRLQIFKWDGAKWNVCRETPWAYGGGGDVRQGDLTFEQRVSQRDGYAPHQPPCGVGYYGTLTSSYVYTGSAWEGAGLWSGNTYAS